MPFSPERTDLIRTRIAERIASGLSNEGEESFLKNMAARFNQYGTKTRLSDAQYKMLNRVLKLDCEGQATSPKPETHRSGWPKTSRAPGRDKPKARPLTIARTVTAVRRAVRRAQRQIMVPIILVLGSFALMEWLFDSASSGYAPYHPQVISTTQVSSANVVHVTGSRVNQREGPSTSTDVMGVLTEGTQVQAVGQQGNWTQIESTLGTGWMASNFLSSRGAIRAEAPLQGQVLRASDVRVIDGDTVDIRGQDANVRLVGFDTPETWRPSCNAELEMGRRATARLRQLLRGAEAIEFKRVACACRAGTEGTKQCNFGRQCGSLLVDRIDVGEVLIGEGLAASYRCGRTSCPPRPQVWCR